MLKMVIARLEGHWGAIKEAEVNFFLLPFRNCGGSSAAWSAAQMHTPSKILSFDLPYQTYVQQECFIW